MILSPLFFIFFFFNDTATTEIYTLSLHDALPISITDGGRALREQFHGPPGPARTIPVDLVANDLPTSRDRKSTRLNSSHGYISYAVFCLKKKKKKKRKHENIYNRVYQI